MAKMILAGPLAGIPIEIGRRFRSVIRERRVTADDACYFEYRPDLGDIQYMCPYRCYKPSRTPWAWGKQEGRRISGTSYWVNDALIILDMKCKIKWIGYERFDGKTLWNMLEPGDAIDCTHMFYDPGVYHAPIVQVESFGVQRFVDGRYLDLIWSWFPWAKASLNLLEEMMVFVEEGARVAGLRPLVLLDEARKSYRRLKEKACIES